LRALRRQSGVVLQAEQLIQAKAEVRPRRLCPDAPTHARAIRRLWPKCASCARVRWAISAQIGLMPLGFDYSAFAAIASGV
jgi:hypothetical protein